MDKNERQEAVAACTTLEELQALGAKLGYKPGWSQHVWDSRAGWRDKEGEQTPVVGGTDVQ